MTFTAHEIITRCKRDIATHYRRVSSPVIGMEPHPESLHLHAPRSTHPEKFNPLRNLPYLYDINIARDKAMRLFRERKASAIRLIIALLKHAEYSLSQLASIVGISKSSAGRYKREILASGAIG